MGEEKMIASMTWREILRLVFDVLNFPLFELGGHGISLGKLISGVLMLMLGYFISGRAARGLDNRLLARLGVEESTRYTLRKFFFYLCMIVATLFTLHTLNFPVTIFTVLGGALAVGIGFGSQNLVNNFISGILVMMGRPIRVQDYVDIDGTSGQVASIGIRSTVLRLGSNALVMIPNTWLIDRKLTNWTQSGTLSVSFRFVVTYATDFARLSEICLKIVGEAKDIENTPAPSVSLADFTDRGLTIELGYSLTAPNYPKRGTIESNVRIRLKQAFEREKIEFGQGLWAIPAPAPAQSPTLSPSRSPSRDP